MYVLYLKGSTSESECELITVAETIRMDARDLKNKVFQPVIISHVHWHGQPKPQMLYGDNTVLLFCSAKKNPAVQMNREVPQYNHDYLIFSYNLIYWKHSCA